MTELTFAVLAATSGAIALGAVGALAWRALRPLPEHAPPPRVRWEALLRPLGGAYGCLGVLPLPSGAMGQELGVAVDLLATHSPWEREDILLALRGVRILVQRRAGVHQWDVRGAPPGCVVVGPDLAELVDGLAHVCEVRLHGRADVAHASWDGSGLLEAEAEWRALRAHAAANRLAHPLGHRHAVAAGAGLHLGE